MTPTPDNRRPDNRLVLLDQAFYAGHRAAGQREIMQVGWIYGRAVDLDGLERLHQNLSRGLLGRLIERSPLPFGRARWVCDPRPAPIDVATCARSRADLEDWFDECTQLPLDPGSGPGWRLCVVPLTDGSNAVSLVLSHYVIDGIGAALAVTEAVLGLKRDLGYPSPRSLTRLRAAVQDANETVRDAPAVGRALVAAVKEARRRQQDADRSVPSRATAVSVGNADDALTAPTIAIRIRLDEWQARAETLGGTSGTLAAAFTAKLDERIGRQHGDSNHVAVLLTVNDRTSQDDVRAVAVSFARVHIDPSELATDLRGARAAIKDALKSAKETQDEDSQLVTLAPFTPRRAWRHLVDYALNDPEQPALCTNLGDTGPAAIRPDGTLCDAVFARGASQHLTQRWLDRIGSQLLIYFGTAAELNLVSICVQAYHPDSVKTKAALRALAAQTLADFGLTGEMGLAWTQTTRTDPGPSQSQCPPGHDAASS